MDTVHMDDALRQAFVKHFNEVNDVDEIAGYIVLIEHAKNDRLHITTSWSGSPVWRLMGYAEHLRNYLKKMASGEVEVE